MNELNAVLLVKAAFNYPRRSSRLQRAVIRLSQQLGLTNFSLEHVVEAHTAERAFRLAETNDF